MIQSEERKIKEDKEELKKMQEERKAKEEREKKKAADEVSVDNTIFCYIFLLIYCTIITWLDSFVR